MLRVACSRVDPRWRAACQRLLGTRWLTNLHEQQLPIQTREPALPRTLQDRLFRQQMQERDSQRLERLPQPPMRDLTPEQSSLLSKIRQCSHDQDADGSFQLFRQIPQDAGPDWVPHFRGILLCLTRCMRYEEAKAVFRGAPARDTIMYNMMLGMLARLRHTHDFEVLLRQMDAEQVPRSSVTYTQMLTSCSESNNWAESLKLLETLKTDPELQASASWDVVYLIAMTACGRARLPDQARGLLQQMQDTGTLAQAKHFNALIVACGDDLQQAEKVMEEMRSAGLTPRAADWRALMVSSRNIRDQTRIYGEMRQAIPDVRLEEAWAIMLRTAALAEDFEAVDKVLEEMKSQGCDPDVDSGVPSLRRALGVVSSRRERAQLQETWDRNVSASLDGEAQPAGIAQSQRPDAAAAGAQDADRLPEGWQSTVDPASGNRYYWRVDNPAGSTTWERPI